MKYMLFSLLIFVSPFAWGAEPEIQTPKPIIHLKDNLDERDKLGWCIDTVGRGFGDRLHAHSCKPHGGDVQFLYNKESLQIISATFSNKCAEVIGSPANGATIALVDCSNNALAQKFYYGTKTFEFRTKLNDSFCLTVGEKSRSAGPFMSRGLFLFNCAATGAKFQEWVIKQE